MCQRLYILTIFIIVIPCTLIAKNKKRYDITDVNIIGQVYEDGKIEITEKRTYKFKRGKFQYAFQQFSTLDENINYENFRVFDENTEFYESEGKENGSFYINEKESYIDVRWYFKAKNESRTFTIKYTIKNIIKKYADVSELYYQAIGNNWKKPQNNVQITIIPPNKIEKYNLNAWVHGPLWNEYKINPDGSVFATAKKLPRRTFFEVRILYPNTIFPELPTIENYMKNQIINEEKKWAEETEIKREKEIIKEKNKIFRWSWGKWFISILSCLAILIWFYLYFTFGKINLPFSSKKMIGEIPKEKISPAYIQYLFNNREIYGSAFIATVIDLANRQLLSIHQEIINKKRFWGNSSKKHYYWNLDRKKWTDTKATLLNHEDKLLDFLFNNISEDKKTIAISDFKANSKKITSFFKNWKKSIKEDLSRYIWFDESSLLGMKYSFILASTMGILSVIFIFFFGPWCMISGATSLVIFGLSYIIPFRSHDGDKIYKKWSPFKNKIKNYPINKNYNSNIAKNVNDYLVYGIIFGITNKNINKLINLIPEDKIATIFPWYIYQSQFDASIFGASFSDMLTTTTSTFYNASGTATNGSVGGGGGSGGGAGGAG